MIDDSNRFKFDVCLISSIYTDTTMEMEMEYYFIDDSDEKEG